jgi:hypothetical protein
MGRRRNALSPGPGRARPQNRPEPGERPCNTTASGASELNDQEALSQSATTTRTRAIKRFNRLAITTDQAGGGRQLTFYNELGHPVSTDSRSSEPPNSIVNITYTGFATARWPASAPLLTQAGGGWSDVPVRPARKDNPAKFQTTASPTKYVGLNQTATDPRGNTRELRSMGSAGLPTSGKYSPPPPL